MAKPRIFMSSTFYDLRYIREDLDRFIKGVGYEPVRHETGAITYGSEKPLDEYAYREVEFCDIVVCIIGGRYGTESSSHEGSITQNELRRALEKGIPVYIFVEANVLSEFSTYQLNKPNTTIKYRFVDDARVYSFLEEIHKLPRNNPITPFSTAAHICDFLETQWAGLFQRFLQEQKRLSEIQVLDEMKSVADTLQELVEFLTKEKRDKDEAIKSILLANHPAFRQFAEKTNTKYRVFFTNKKELNTWLHARQWKQVNDDEYDEDSVYEWQNTALKKYIKLTHEIFDHDGRLIPFTDKEWNNEWLQISDYTPKEDDDVPF